MAGNGMKLWRISQSANSNWDTYDSAIVAAEDELGARDIHPSGKWDERDNGVFYNSDWTDKENVKVEYIGEAKDGTNSGVILASFNAG